MLVRTGTEEGLSSPISSDPIAPRITGFTCGSRRELAVETTLETTVDFVMDLEKREVAAFGPRPDPVASTEGFEDGYFRGPAEFYEAICLGWPEDERLVGPSSRWIDVEKCPKWTGWSEGEVRYSEGRVERARKRLCLRQELEALSGGDHRPEKWL